MSVRLQSVANGEEMQQATDFKVILNVGGQRHETHLSTLNNFTDTRLTWISEQIKLDPRPNREFFFDRHPGLFSHILNYFRTGKLHAPRDICGPMFAEELSYWGIDSKLIEPCCWSYFDEHNELEEKLQGFGPLDDKDSIVESLSEDDLDDEENFDDLCEGYPSAEKVHSSEKCWEQARKSWQRYCKSIWRLLENPYSSTLAWVISFVSLILTFLVVVLFCISTLQKFDQKERNVVLYSLETASICWFTMEFLVRLVTSPDKKTFLKTMQTWVDVLAILPFYLELAFPHEEDLRVLKLLYVLRLYRAFRAFRFSYVLQVFIQTIKGSFRELFLLFFIFSILVLTYGSLAYYAERKQNSAQFSSIPASFWWSLITMTTVGYGDITPDTLYGKLVGAACALSGVLMMALPVSVVASNFSLYNNYAKVKLKLPPRPEKKILSSAIQSMKFNAPETSIINSEEQPKMPNGRRRSYRSRSRYSSVIPTLEEEDRMEEEIEMTKRSQVTEEKPATPQPEKKTYPSKPTNGSPMPTRTKEVRISIPEIPEY